MDAYRRSVRCIVLCAAMWPMAAPGQTGSYPAKPVRIIVPFPAGGSVDFNARAIADRLAEQLGQQIVIDNRGGASGSIGSVIAARSAPDGYTLVLQSVPFVTAVAAGGRRPWVVASTTYRDVTAASWSRRASMASVSPSTSRSRRSRCAATHPPFRHRTSRHRSLARSVNGSRSAA